MFFCCVKMVKILGIDEAGRGPVIGPMVIAGVMIEGGCESILGEVKDSKFVFPRKRERLKNALVKTKGVVYKVLVVEPEVIDAAVLSGELNLNWLEAHKQAEIINELNPDVAIIDCPSINESAFKAYLQKLVDNKKIKLVVEHKADALYKVASAASILAKVERDRQMELIRKRVGDCGPGYPSNKKTQDFVKNNWDKFPEIFRKSWSTYKKYAQTKGQKDLGSFEKFAI